MSSEASPGGCSKIVDLLVDYLEERLPSGTREELSHCSSCVTQLRTYQTTVSMLRGLCDEDLPRELRHSVETFLEGQTNH